MIETWKTAIDKYFALEFERQMRLLDEVHESLQLTCAQILDDLESQQLTDDEILLIL